MEVCRTCLRTAENMLSLHEDLKLVQKIETISSIEITFEDRFPNKVCNQCIVNINLSYNFRRVIVNSDKELRDRYENLNVESNSNDLKDLSLIFNVKAEQSNCDYLDLSLDTLVNGEAIEQGTDTKPNGLQETTENKAVNKIRLQMRRRLFKCNECNFRSVDCTTLKSHKQIHVTTICPICGKCITSINLKQHMAVHTDNPVECQKCGKISKNNAALRAHMVLHNGLNCYCTKCGMFCKERSTYRAHMKTHMDEEKLYIECFLCYKKLKGKRSLQKHIRSHTGEKPFKCEVCKGGFSSSHALKTHERQHTNEKPYQCDICSIAFTQKVSLRKHLSTKHDVIE